MANDATNAVPGRDSEGLQPIENLLSNLPEVSEQKAGHYAPYPGPHINTYGSSPALSARPYAHDIWESSTEAPKKKILGLRWTTFLLTLSNVLLAIALITVGTVEGRAAAGRSSNDACEPYVYSRPNDIWAETQS